MKIVDLLINCGCPLDIPDSRNIASFDWVCGLLEGTKNEPKILINNIKSEPKFSVNIKVDFPPDYISNLEKIYNLFTTSKFSIPKRISYFCLKCWRKSDPDEDLKLKTCRAHIILYNDLPFGATCKGISNDFAIFGARMRKNWVRDAAKVWLNGCTDELHDWK